MMPMTLMPVTMAVVMTAILRKKVVFFYLSFLTKVIDDPFAEVGSDIDLETGDALGGDGGDGGGDGGGKNESTVFLN